MQSQTSLLSVPENERLSFSGRQKQQQQQEQQQQEQLHAEIIHLLNKVLPPDDEINTTIDAMMEEYVGREDQLLNSLKRMHQEEEGEEEDATMNAHRKISPSSSSESEVESLKLKAVDGPVDPDDFISDVDDDGVDGVVDSDESGNGSSIEIFEDDLHRYHEDGIGLSSPSSPSSSSPSDNDGNGRNDHHDGEEGTWASDDDDDDDDDGGGFDVDRWQEDLESQLDESNTSRSNQQQRRHDAISNPQSGVGTLKTPPEQLERQQQQQQQQQQQFVSHAEEKKNDSSPRPSKAYYEYVEDRDQDENDYSSSSSSSSLKRPVAEVDTRMRSSFRQISALTHPDSFASSNSNGEVDGDNITTATNDNSAEKSEFPDSFISNVGEEDDFNNSDSFRSREDAEEGDDDDNNVGRDNGQEIVRSSREGDDDNVDREIVVRGASKDEEEAVEVVEQVEAVKEEGGKGKRSVAILKLRVWDPARPRVRLKWHASARIILPNQDTYAEATATTREARREDVIAIASSSSVSSLGNSAKRLSMVREEPATPTNRGDSFLDDENPEHVNVLDDVCRRAGLQDDDDDNNDDGNGNGNGNGNNNNNPLWGVGRSKLAVGTLVGIQLDASNNNNNNNAASNNSSFGSSFTSTTSFNGKRNYEWNVDDSVNVHRVELLPLRELSLLHAKMERNCPSLRELIMDGLPQSSFPTFEAAELLLEALATNTSIHRFSMRRSHVADDVGSLFALALVDNRSLAQLNLEGNHMTNVSAKNFYSVLKKNNGTLRLLDLSDNPEIDDDVGSALDQFMGQRALKRTLTNKGERARRAARGMPVDETLEEDYYGDYYGDHVGSPGDGAGVTVVGAQDTVEEVLRGINGGGGGGDRREEEEDDDDEARRHDDEEQPIMDDSSSSRKMMPRPDEDFRDFMLRMDEEKESNNVSSSYHRKLMDESLHDREAFDNFSGSSVVPSSSSSSSYSRQYPSDQSAEEEEEEASLAEEEEDVRLSPNNNHVHSNESTGSSITTRSPHRSGTENDIILTTTSVAGRGVVPPTKRMETTMETLQSADENESGESQESASYVNGTETTTSTTTNQRNPPGRISDAVGTRESTDGDSAVSRRAKDASSAKAAPAVRPTLPGAVRADSLEVSEGDYLDKNAGRRTMHRLLADQNHEQHGAFQVDEMAPARQNRGGRGRARGRRTESERMARMAELEAGGGGDMIDADIERADDSYIDEMYGRMGSRKRSSRFSSLIGLEGEDDGLDRKIFGIVGVLLVGLLVMVVFLFMNKGR